VPGVGSGPGVHPAVAQRDGGGAMHAAGQVGVLGEQERRQGGPKSSRMT
jgi:hypothetical protein